MILDHHTAGPVALALPICTYFAEEHYQCQMSDCLGSVAVVN